MLWFDIKMSNLASKNVLFRHKTSGVTSVTTLYIRFSEEFSSKRFYFGWLKIKWIYIAFNISITLLSNHLKQNSSELCLFVTPNRQFHRRVYWWTYLWLIEHVNELEHTEFHGWIRKNYSGFKIQGDLKNYEIFEWPRLTMLKRG